MIAYYGLNDRQAQTASVLLARVIRSEDARALFGREPRASVGDFDDDLLRLAAAEQGELSSLRHRVHRIEYEIGDSAVQQFRIGCDWAKTIVRFQMAFYGAATAVAAFSRIR
jgi:hypothetical protein